MLHLLSTAYQLGHIICSIQTMYLYLVTPLLYLYVLINVIWNYCDINLWQQQMLTNILQAITTWVGENTLQDEHTTIECTAPIRAQANMATTSSTTIGMQMETRSPFFTPLRQSTSFDFSNRYHILKSLLVLI